MACSARSIPCKYLTSEVACLGSNLSGLVGLFQFQIAGAHQRVKVYYLCFLANVQRVHQGENGYPYAQEALVVVLSILRGGKPVAGSRVVPLPFFVGAVVGEGKAKPRVGIFF